jgi:hypothetical protein
VSATRDTRFGIGRTVPATRDTRVRLVVLVYCQARATPNDRFRPNADTTHCQLPRGPVNLMSGAAVTLVARSAAQDRGASWLTGISGISYADAVKVTGRPR